MIEQPRHLLPLVVGLALVVGVTLGRAPLFAAAVVALVAAASLPLVRERHRSLPAAAQAAAYVARAFPPGQVVVFGGRSLRFFPPSVASRERTWLSEADVELERLDVLPPYVLVTSEVESDPQRAARLSPLRTFCRDRRIDRALPCVTLSAYRIGGQR